MKAPPSPATAWALARAASCGCIGSPCVGDDRRDPMPSEGARRPGDPACGRCYRAADRPGGDDMADEPKTTMKPSGIKQRNKIVMTQDEIDEFLQGRHSLTMSTIAGDGSIHSIAMWYGFLEGAVAIESKAKAQKVVNLRRNPTMTMLVEDGETYEELRGVSLVGKAEIVEEPDRVWDLGVSVFSRYNAPYTEEMKPFVEIMLNKRVVVKMNVEKVISWDHRKLGGGY